MEVAITDTLLPPDIGNGDIEFATAAVNSSFRGTADDNAANSIGHKGESAFEQDDSADIVDIGNLGVNDGDDHASDDTEYRNESSSLSPSLSQFNVRNGEDGEDWSADGVAGDGGLRNDEDGDVQENVKPSS